MLTDFQVEGDAKGAAGAATTAISLERAMEFAIGSLHVFFFLPKWATERRGVSTCFTNTSGILHGILSNFFGYTVQYICM